MGNCNPGVARRALGVYFAPTQRRSAVETNLDEKDEQEKFLDAMLALAALPLQLQSDPVVALRCALASFARIFEQDDPGRETLANIRRLALLGACACRNALRAKGDTFNPDEQISVSAYTISEALDGFEKDFRRADLPAQEDLF